MSNDLISRSALKNKFISTISVGRLEFEDIINLIDNAPAVPLPDFKAGYKQAIIDGKTNFSRPQGEWIAVKDKLPDIDGCYLVSLENGQIVVAHSSGIIENHDFEPKMLAWQPLPEPYK